MRALAFLRARRRVSGAMVAALLLFGAVGSLHHHRLTGPSATLAIGQASDESHQARTVDCVFCRAADPVRLVVIHQAARPLIIASPLIRSEAVVVAASTSSWFSPRGPPAIG